MASNFKERIPRSAKFLAFIRQQPCVICSTTQGIHAHHTQPGGMGIKGSDYSAVPLCFNCHNRNHQTAAKHDIPNLKVLLVELMLKYKGEQHKW